MNLKPLAVAGTVLGAVAGAGAVALGVATAPIALPVAIGAGIVVDVIRHKRHPPGPLAPAPLQAIVAAANVPGSAVQQAAKQAALSPATDPANVAAKALDATYWRAISQQAVLMQAALVAHDPGAYSAQAMLWSPLSAYVKRFQAAFNTSPVANTMGKLGVSGKLGGRTGAAMTLYTHRVYSQDPTAGPND